MKSKFLPLLPTLFFLALTSCNEAGNGAAVAEEIPIELATTPTPDSTGEIVNGTKMGSALLVAEDVDHDSIADAGDNCPSISNQDQADADEDGIGDACAKL